MKYCLSDPLFSLLTSNIVVFSSIIGDSLVVEMFVPIYIQTQFLLCDVVWEQGSFFFHGYRSIESRLNFLSAHGLLSSLCGLISTTLRSSSLERLLLMELVQKTSYTLRRLTNILGITCPHPVMFNRSVRCPFYFLRCCRIRIRHLCHVWVY